MTGVHGVHEDPELIGRRESLAEYLRVSGASTDPRWLTAFETVPRHLFVPQFTRTSMHEGQLLTETIATPSPRWRDVVYTDTHLLTRPDGTSSSTAPSLMARMLDALGASDGADVLEIGTGTGYNTALLCRRLGSHHVYSLDVDPELVKTARVALRAVGHDPALLARDGRLGLPECAPYHHILATCRMDTATGTGDNTATGTVPSTWVGQLAPHGTIVAPISTGIVRLVADARSHTATGGFLPDEAYFMTARPAAARPDLSRVARTAGNAIAVVSEPLGVRAELPDPAGLWTDPPARFWLELMVPGVVRGQTGDTALYYRSDGSWIRVTDRAVERGGPRDLWQEIVRAHQHWATLGRPGRDRIGLTVTPTEHSLWLDTPHTVIRHRLTPANP